MPLGAWASRPRPAEKTFIFLSAMFLITTSAAGEMPALPVAAHRKTTNNCLRASHIQTDILLLKVELIIYILYSSHRQGNTIATSVNLCYFDGDVLVELYHIPGIADIFVSQLGDVDKTILMNTYIHKGTKLGDVGDYARQHHTN